MIASGKVLLKKPYILLILTIMRCLALKLPLFIILLGIIE